MILILNGLTWTIRAIRNRKSGISIMTILAEPMAGADADSRGRTDSGGAARSEGQAEGKGSKPIQGGKR